jgi:hypothetical protein
MQGAPYGFQTACLPLVLRKRGLSYSRLGTIKLQTHLNRPETVKIMPLLPCRELRMALQPACHWCCASVACPTPASARLCPNPTCKNKCTVCYASCPMQGAPYGFQTACLPLVLRKRGLSYSRLGTLKLLFLPWVCKPFYAPFVERTR